MIQSELESLFGTVFDDLILGIGVILDQGGMETSHEIMTHMADQGAQLTIENVDMKDGRVKPICRLASRAGRITVKAMKQLYGFPHSRKRHFGCRCGYRFYLNDTKIKDYPPHSNV